MLLLKIKEYWQWFVGAILVLAAYALGKKQTGINSDDLEDMLENSENEKQKLMKIQKDHLKNKKIIEADNKRQVIELEEWKKSEEARIEEKKKDSDDVFAELGIKKK